MLAIGDLAERTGVAVTALRYYDELGLVRPVAREGGRRRYDEDAVQQVGVVLFLRDVGFTLAEVSRMVAGGSWRALAKAKLVEVSRMVAGGSWRALAKAKLVELEEQAANIAAARDAIQHALDCPAKEPAACPRFWAIVEARLAR